MKKSVVFTCLAITLFLIIAVLIYFKTCNSEIPNTPSVTIVSATPDLSKEYISPEEFDWQYGGRTAYFNSIDGLAKGLLMGFTEDVLSYIEYEEVGRGIGRGTFRAFHEKFIEKNQLMVPYYKGKAIQLENFGEGYASISLHYQNLFSRPWIWYNGLVGDSGIGIRTMYIDDELVKESNEKGVSWLISTITPNSSTPEYPNFDNYMKDKYVESLCELELQLDGYSTTALIRKDYDVHDPRLYVHFIYENVLVIITIYPDAFESGILQDLSFQTINLK